MTLIRILDKDVLAGLFKVRTDSIKCSLIDDRSHSRPFLATLWPDVV